MPFLYSLKHVHKARPGGNVVFELHVPEFHTSFGEFIAVVGPSGCGKSTFLDLLALVLRPAENHPSTFRFYCSTAAPNGYDIIHFWKSGQENKISMLRRRQIGYVLQTGGLLPFLSVRQNIGLACRLKGLDLISNRIQKIANLLGIEDQLNKKPQHVSGGERQRVAIARALIHEPAVILADEPTAAVDHDRALIILREFAQLAKKNGTGIILATHNYSLVREIADKTIRFKITHTFKNGKKKTVSTLTHFRDYTDGDKRPDPGFADGN